MLVERINFANLISEENNTENPIIEKIVPCKPKSFIYGQKNPFNRNHFRNFTHPFCRWEDFTSNNSYWPSPV